MLPDDVGASNTVIIEPCGLHEGRLEQVPAVHHDWVAQELLHAAKIQRRKIFPLGEHQAGVSAFKGFISPSRELDWAIGAKFLRSTAHGCRIVRSYRTAFFQQSIDDGDGGRFAQVVGAVFESQTKYSQLFAFQSPERFADFTHEAVALLLIYSYGFIQQAEVAAVFPRHRAEGKQVFGKT